MNIIENSPDRFLVGRRVTTSMGHGTIVGKCDLESRSPRFLVRLDDPSRWSCSELTNSTPAFWRRDLTILREQTQ